jgi:hypothetical protein
MGDADGGLVEGQTVQLFVLAQHGRIEVIESGPASTAARGRRWTGFLAGGSRVGRLEHIANHARH